MKKLAIGLVGLIVAFVAYSKLGPAAFLLALVFALGLLAFTQAMKSGSATPWRYMKGLSFVGVLFGSVWAAIVLFAVGFLPFLAMALAVFGCWHLMQFSNRKIRTLGETP